MSSGRKDAGAPGQKIEQWRGVGNFGTLGLEIVLCIAFGFFGGRWLDEKFDTAPYLAGLGFVFGIAAAIKSVMRVMAEMKRVAEREEREQGNPLPKYDVRGDERRGGDIKNDVKDDDDASDERDDDASEDGKKADR